MKKLRIVLALITRENDYQREQASVAEETAARLGIELEVLYANGDAIAQTQQLLAALRAPVDARPNAIVVEPVGTGMASVAKAAADAGIGWIVLNRAADYLAPIRAASTAPVGSVDCDNMEVGRIQGRQFGALLPDGGAVLYIEGATTDTSKQRRAGMEETLPKNIEIRTARGKWTEDSGFQALAARLHADSTGPSVRLIGCQNDAMAMGARRAVEQLADARFRDQWLALPLTGCDGVRETGLLAVQRGLLKATVITPALTGVALDLLVNAISNGTQVAERTLTKAISYPPIDQLRAL